MRKLDLLISNNPGKVFWCLILISLPAFYTNLGLLPLFADEPTRANVALEMLLTGNFSVPTVGGEFYYNKPPFYNWILAAFYYAAGNYSELTTRLPAFISLFLFSATIYYFVLKFMRDKKIAALSGLLFLVNGRMLIYDSMLGHIDIFYSWLTFCGFMIIYYFLEQKSWFRLFFFSYLITAVTFLCKGLPSILFQGFSLIAVTAYTKNIRQFFSWKHILSGVICLSIIGAYFLNYYQFNPNLQEYFVTLWDQSSRRTATNTGFLKTITHLFAFPFEHAGHLFPASLLFLFCFHKGFIQGLRQHPFLKFAGLIFLANIWVYWLSPETRPRYLFMLYPLLFILISHAYYTYRDQLPAVRSGFYFFITGLALLVTVSIPVVLFLDISVPFKIFKVLFLLISCSLLSWLIISLKNSKLIPFLVLVLMVRLGFSWFVLPHRLENRSDTYFREAAIEMGTISKSTPFFFYQYHPDDALIPFHDRLIFYIQRERMQQVKFTEVDVMPGYYFTFDRDLKNPDAVLVRTYQNLKLFQVK